MHASDTKPTGTVTGFCRLQKQQGAAFVQLVDLTRYELSPQCLRFREENWRLYPGQKPVAVSRGRNSSNFLYSQLADKHFAWWLEIKLQDGYRILDLQGNPGPTPKT